MESIINIHMHIHMQRSVHVTGLFVSVVSYILHKLISHPYTHRQAIMGSIRRHKHAMSALLAEYIDKDDVESTKALNEEAKR